MGKKPVHQTGLLKELVEGVLAKAGTVKPHDLREQWIHILENASTTHIVSAEKRLHSLRRQIEKATTEGRPVSQVKMVTKDGKSQKDGALAQVSTSDSTVAFFLKRLGPLEAGILMYNVYKIFSENGSADALAIVEIVGTTVCIRELSDGPLRSIYLEFCRLRRHRGETMWSNRKRISLEDLRAFVLEHRPELERHINKAVDDLARRGFIEVTTIGNDEFIRNVIWAE